MNENHPTIEELLAHPHVQGLVSQENADRIAESLSISEQAEKDPIYIRILSGIGAWFSAVFLIIFLVISDIFDSSAAALISGVIFLVAAIFILRANKGTFLSQLSLALAFAGNILVLGGVIDIIRWGDEFSVVLITHALICIVVYPLFADSIYRFLAPIALAAIATAWIIEEKIFVFMHVLIAAETILAGVLLLRKKRPPFLTPLVYSAATMLPATLLFMNFMQIDTWRIDFNEPLWPSSILLAGGLIFLYYHLAGGSNRLREPWMILAIVSTLLLGIFTTPGILVAIALLFVGYAFGDRILTPLSYLFLPCFLVLFYYALNVDLAHKSWIIGGSGVILLIVRWIAGHCQPEEVAT
jgi:hypothetical protein